MKPEETVFDQNVAGQTENTVFENESTENKEEKVSAKAVQSENKGVWKTATIGGVTGMVFGAGSTVLANEVMKPGEEVELPAPSPDPTPTHPAIVDSDIAVATCVDDRMTFSQAFAAARAEVGSGGVFEWHGNLYGTYTAEEWNSMTPEQRADYNEHFSWGQTNRHEDPNNEVTNAHVVNQTTDDVEVVSYGVMHDAESGVNVGIMSVDGHEVVLTDVDNDQVFDYAATDLNGDNELQANEIVDISGQQLTVDALGGFVNEDPGAQMMASASGVDEGEVYED